jgi:hypothetical protein
MMANIEIEIIEIVRSMNEMVMMMERIGSENPEIVDVIVVVVVVVTIGKMHGNKAAIIGRVEVCIEKKKCIIRNIQANNLQAT